MITRRDWFEVTTSLLGGAGIGAALMYLLDPESGQERREYIARRTGDVWETAAEGVRNTGETLGESLSGGWSGLADRARDLSDEIVHRTRKSGQRAADRTRDWADQARGMIPSGRSLRQSVGLEPEGSSGTTVALAAFGALALGAGLMYIMDPQSGRRRRALVRDKAVHYAHEASDAVSSKGKDLRNRATGMYHEARKAVVGSENPGQGQTATSSQTSSSSTTSNQGAYCPPGGASI